LLVGGAEIPVRDEPAASRLLLGVAPADPRHHARILGGRSFDLGGGGPLSRLRHLRTPRRARVASPGPGNRAGPSGGPGYPRASGGRRRSPISRSRAGPRPRSSPSARSAGSRPRLSFSGA